MHRKREFDGLIAAMLGGAAGIRRVSSNVFRKGRTQKRYSGPGVGGTLVRTCPGGRHAWFQTSVGLVRKPYLATQEAAPNGCAVQG